ncbi:MAG: molybdopterin-dependent oxidoreductase, partial [Thermoanaerobaculia bacterium]|nr:molybdopterin-dependent oxidoreductase [Thermoanaerobaculia bacterium]
IRSLDRAIAEKRFYPQSPPSAAGMTHIPRIVRPGSDARWLAEPEQPLAAGRQSCKSLAGTQQNGFQNHFYLETMAALAVPGENRSMTLYVTTQSLADNQYNAAGLLGVAAADVRVIVSRDGGAFGGRQTRSRFVSAAAALAAWVLQQPVRLVVDRNTNFVMFGERHPFRGDYHVAVAEDGRLAGLKVDFYSNAGNTYDVSFPVMDLCLLSADACYQVDTYEVTAEVCQTNQLSNTAFRTFGSVQSTNIVETALEHAAHALGKRPEEIREKNLYRLGSRTPTGYRITEQTLDVLLAYGFAKKDVRALRPLRGKYYPDDGAFKAAVDARTSAFGATESWITLQDFSTTAYDYTPYLQSLQYCNVRRLWQECKEWSGFERRAAAVDAFNSENRFKKRGISMMPLKYGIAYTDRAGCSTKAGLT